MSTPMQPVYLTGHSRPVNQVKHNYDGDLLFTCSDDGTVCMYETNQLMRIGVFKINEACRSIDLTKNSKHMIAAATTVGVQVYDVKSGERLHSVQVPGVNAKMVSLSFGDNMVMCLYEFEKKSYIRVFNMDDIFSGNTPKVEHEIQTSNDHVFTKAVWGPKNETIVISTNNGKLLQYHLMGKEFIHEAQPHRGEIFTMEMTYDYTMLLTGSRDGYAKLIHPDSFKIIKEYHYGKPCRSASISPLFDSDKHQRFHCVVAGGQDARDVTTTGSEAGGFEMKMYNMIFGEKLVEVHGHFGPVHSTNFSPDGFSFASGAEDGYVHYHRFPPEYFTKKFE